MGRYLSKLDFISVSVQINLALLLSVASECKLRNERFDITVKVRGRVGRFIPFCEAPSCADEQGKFGCQTNRVEVGLTIDAETSPGCRSWSYKIR